MNDQSIVAPKGTGRTKSFGSQSLERAHETASTAVAAQAKAAIESRYVMAMQRPRDMDAARVSLLADCKRPSFAKVARYILPFGGGIEGLSIRFVEAALRAMRNVLVESPTIYEDDEKRIVRVSVTDLEANVYYSKDIVIAKTIERKSLRRGQKALSTRANSYGDLLYIVEATEDELATKQGALESKAVRTLGMRLIPGDLVDEAERLCIETAAAEDAADPDRARKELVDAFVELGVQPRDLVAYLGHDVAQSSPAELHELRGVFVALRDGEATWLDAIEHKRAERGELDEDDAKKAASSKGGESLKKILADRRKADAKAREESRKEATPAQPPQTKTKGGGKKTATPAAEPQLAEEDDVPDFPVDEAAAAAARPKLEEEDAMLIFARAEEAIQEATSTEEIEAGLKTARPLGDADRKALSALAQKRAVEIGGQ